MSQWPHDFSPSSPPLPFLFSFIPFSSFPPFKLRGNENSLLFEYSSRAGCWLNPRGHTFHRPIRPTSPEHAGSSRPPTEYLPRTECKCFPFLPFSILLFQLIVDRDSGEDEDIERCPGSPTRSQVAKGPGRKETDNFQGIYPGGSPPPIYEPSRPQENKAK